MDPDLALDPELAQVLQGRAETAPPVGAPTPGNVEIAANDPDLALDPELNAALTGQSAPPATGEIAEPLPGWDKGFQAITDRLTIGGATISKAFAGFDLGSGKIDMDGAHEAVETEDLIKAQAATDEYKRRHAYLQMFKLKDLPGWDQEDETGLHASDVPGWLIEQVPNMGVTIAGGLAGNVVGSLGGGRGAQLGGFIGTAAISGFMMYGNHVYDAMEMGVDRDTAVVGGVITGTIGGVLSAIGLEGMMSTTPKAASAFMKTAGFQQLVKQVAGVLARGAFTEVATEDLQQAVDSAMKAWETRASASATKQYSWGDFRKDMIQSTLQSAVGGAGFAGAGTFTGSMTGAIARQIKGQVDRSTAQFEQKQAQEQAAQAAQAAQEQHIANAELDKKVQGKQASARRALRGYVEVTNVPTVQDAQVNYDNAKARAKLASDENKAVAQLAVAQAEAELKQAQYQAHTEILEDALSDPEILKTVAAQRELLEEKLIQLKDWMADAQTAADKKHIGEMIRKTQGELRKVKDLQNLNSEEAVKGEINKLKGQVEKHASDTRKQVAKASLKKRMAERDKVITKLRADLDAQRDSDRTAFQNTRDRLETVRQQQELDQLTVDLIDEGLIDGNDEAVKDLSAKSPTRRLMGLVKIAKNKIDQAAGKGAKAKEKMLTAAKKLVDAVIDHSRLDANDKNRLKAKYRNVSLESMVEVLDELQTKISDIFEKRRLEAARTDFKNLLDLKIDKTTMSKFPGVEELLLAIKQWSKDFDAIEEFEDKVSQQAEVSELDEAKLDLANLFPVPLDEMTADQIELLIDTYTNLRETGKAEALKRIQERQERQARKLAEVHHRIAPTAEGRKRQASLPGKIAKLFDDVWQSHVNTWRGLMTIVSQLGDISDMTDLFDVKSAHSEMHRIRIKWENRFKELVANAGISEKAWAKFIMNAHKKAEGLYHRSASGARELLVHPDTGEAYTMHELIQVRNYLLDQDPDAISRLADGNGFSYPGQALPYQSTLEVIEDHLNANLPNWEAAADAMREFYREFHEVVDDASFRRYGRHIPMNESYGGELLSSSEPGSRFRETFRRITTRPRSLKRRQGGSARVEIRSALDNLKNHIQQYARESAFMEFEQDAQHVFNDQTTKDLITRNVGKNTLKVIHNYIEDIALGMTRNYTQFDRWAAAFRQNIYTRFLGARPEQFAKQLTGMVHAMQFIGPKAWIEGVAYMIADPQGAIDLMNKSGLFQARRIQRDPDFHPADVAGRLKKFNEAMMLSVELGDRYSVAGAAFPVLLKVLKETGDEAAAIRAFETAFDTTQSSGSVDELPALFRGSPWTRLLTVLTQEPTRQTEAISTAWRKAVAKPTKENKMNFVRVVAVTYTGAFLYNMVGYMIAFPFMNDDEREKKLNYILNISPWGPMSGMALIGQLISSSTNAMVGVTFNQNTSMYEPNMISADPVSDSFDLFMKTLKMGDGADTEETWKWILSAGNLAGDVTGVPVTNILKRTVQPKQE